MMDRKLIEKYEREMMEMYASVHPTVPAVSQAVEEMDDASSTGGLIVSVTTARGLYPVMGAVVTVFSGEGEQMQTIDSDKSDESGRTKLFILSTPSKSLSESAGATERPYAVYNVSVEADGYVKQEFMNVPVFSGVTSLQNADLLSMSAAGDNTATRVFDEGRAYEL